MELLGLWAVSGKNELTFNERVVIEAYYANNYSFKMDIKIFIKTFKVLFTMKGAR